MWWICRVSWAYLSAKRRKETEMRCSEGTRIAFSGGTITPTI
ncbi:MAG: hypothetical protein ACU0FH_10735 [Heliomarina sp.]